MFRLESPYYFLMLVALLLLFVLHQYYKQRSLQLWNELGQRKTLIRSFYENISTKKLVHILFFTVCALLIISLVNPQYGLKKEKVKSSSAEIILALDVSQSMMAEDIKPNRLTRARIWIKQFTDRFFTDKIGLISFAGNAYLQSPLTTDVATINMLSASADPSLASTQGTSLANVIDLAIQSFASKDGHHKLLILLTDGEDHEGEAVEKAKEAAKAGITIICIPIGTPEGAAIPIQSSYGSDFKKDQDRQVIITKPNIELLEKICQASDGQVMDLNQGEEVFVKLKEKLKVIMKKETSIQSFSEFESYYQWPLALALLALLAMIYYNEKSKN